MANVCLWADTHSELVISKSVVFSNTYPPCWHHNGVHFISVNSFLCINYKFSNCLRFIYTAWFCWCFYIGDLQSTWNYICKLYRYLFLKEDDFELYYFQIHYVTFDCSTLGCPVLHILKQIMPLWDLILYAIILSLIDFQSFPRWFTIRKSGIQYTKDFQKL